MILAVILPWYIFISLLLGLVGMFLCCCEGTATTPVCTRAICSNGGPLGTPVQYQVDISGFADSNCPANSCGNLDGSYTFTIPSGCSATINDSPGPINEYDPFAVPICGVASATFTVTLTFTATTIEVGVIYQRVVGQQNSHLFRYSGAAVDCGSLSGLNLLWVNDRFNGIGSGAGAACTGAGATVTVTKL